MYTKIYWIKKVSHYSGRLGVMPRPRGDDWLTDELSHLKTQGVDILACLLESIEMRDLGLSEEESVCKNNGLSFRHFPIPDYSVPVSVSAMKMFCRELASELKNGKSVVIHCRQGIGRSAIIASGVLSFCEVSIGDAISAVAEARGIKVPETTEQLEFLLNNF